jgi:hypothetical protein
MVLGTSTGWTKTLSLVGVGYRAAVSGKTLSLNLGYSHPIDMEIPQGLEVKVSRPRVLSAEPLVVSSTALGAHLGCGIRAVCGQTKFKHRLQVWLIWKKLRGGTKKACIVLHKC